MSYDYHVYESLDSKPILDYISKLDGKQISRGKELIFNLCDNLITFYLIQKVLRISLLLILKKTLYNV